MKNRFTFSLCALFFAASPALAQTAGMVSFQGLIRTSGGAELPNGTQVALEFRIYNDDAAPNGTVQDMDGDGTLELTADGPGEGTDVIKVEDLPTSNGLVSTKFGPVSPKVFAGCTPGTACRWLEVRIVDATPSLPNLPSVLSRIEMVTPPGATEQVNVLQSGNSALVTDANGNVGIGTAPETRLKINGILSFNRLPDDMPNAGFIGLEGIFPGRALSLVGSGTNPTNRRVHVFDILTVGDTSGSQFNVNTVQNRVGIGTTAPQTKLHVSGPELSSHTGTTLGSLVIDAPFSGAGYTSLDFASNHSNIPAARISAFHHGVLGSSLNFGTSNSYGLGITNTAMTIDSIGNVGIGTTTPAERLHIRSSGNTFARIESTNSGAGIRLISDGVGDTGMYSPTSTNDLYFFTQVGINAMALTSAGNLGIGTTTPGARLDVNGNARVSGNVGIGTPNPVAKLHVVDSALHLQLESGVPNGDIPLRFFNSADAQAWDLRYFNPGNGIGIFNVANSQWSLACISNGNVGIGTFTPGAKLHVDGNIITTNGTCCSSDARLKKNVNTVATALGKLLALRGVWFQWIDPAKHGDEARRQMGMIAQEVEKVLPEWVITDKCGYRYLNTNGFPALAVEAMREMKSENDALKNRVSSMESELAELRRMVNTISANPARGVTKP